MNKIYRNSRQSNLTTDWPPTFEEIAKSLEEIEKSKDSERGVNPNGYIANYSECGFPHHLLLPKGTPEGMTFDLLAFLTNATEDYKRPEEEDDFNTPYIICGNYNGGSVTYPDNKPMGYPFDRKIFSLKQNENAPSRPPRYLEEYVSHVPNMKTTQVRCLCFN